VKLTAVGLAGIISGVSSTNKARLRGISAVLFDLDGTLGETRIDFSAMKGAMLAQARGRGLEAANLSGLDILAIVEQAAAHLPESEREAYREEAWRKLEEFELRHISEARPMPGACQSALRLHEAGLRLGIITRNCRAAADHLLALLPPVFEVCLTREDVSRCKPDPLHIRAALDLMRVEPKQALVAGDHRMDVQAGKAAGAFAAGILAGRPRDYFDAYEPDAVFRTLKELADALIGPDR
jgi:phosphoglycolate phosphatase